MTRNIPRIVSANSEPKDYTVRLGWDNGAETLADFSRIAGRGIFGAMNEPEFFKQVSVEPHGHSITWPGELDFDADALWFTAKPQDKPDSLKKYDVATTIPNKLIVPPSPGAGIVSDLKGLLRSTARRLGFRPTTG